MKAVGMILDADMGIDCDDAGAMALMDHLADLGGVRHAAQAAKTPGPGLPTRRFIASCGKILREKDRQTATQFATFKGCLIHFNKVLRKLCQLSKP